MSFSDYYEWEPSDADLVIEEAAKKIADLIKQQCKTQIDSDRRAREQLEKANDTQFNEIRRLERELENTENELASAKVMLETGIKLGELVPYHVGDYLWTGIPETGIMKCPTCNGTGRITRIFDGCEFSGTCPSCNNNYDLHEYSPEGTKCKTAEWSFYRPARVQIDQITIKLNERGVVVMYHFVETHFSFPDCSVFDNKEDCEQYCTDRNRTNYVEACSKVGVEPIKEGVEFNAK